MGLKNHAPDSTKTLHCRLSRLTKKSFIELVEWDKKWAKRIQNKYKLSDYQMLCLSWGIGLGKGFVLGALIL